MLYFVILLVFLFHPPLPHPSKSVKFLLLLNFSNFLPLYDLYPQFFLIGLFSLGNNPVPISLLSFFFTSVSLLLFMANFKYIIILRSHRNLSSFKTWKMSFTNLFYEQGIGAWGLEGHMSPILHICTFDYLWWTEICKY